MRFCRLIGLILIISAVATAGVTPSEGMAASGSKTTKTAKLPTKTVKSASKATKKKAVASKSSKKRYSSRHAPQPRPYSALVVDADTGRVLYEKNASGTRYPASLTKMMTLYLTFDALRRGKLSLDEDMPVSKKAASQPQTNIALEKGDRLDVRTAIESLVVRSANDAAMVLAEAIGGTEWNFALMMTQKARQLGMNNTVFQNPSGLPDNSQHTTAFDMARLAIALRRDFPEYYHFFSLQSFSHNGITYPSHNRVMERYDGVDGVKTGYIRASGFNLVTSVKKNGHNLVAVIIGGKSSKSRDNEMIDLLDRTFAKLDTAHRGVADRSDGDEEGNASYMSLEGIRAVAQNPG